MSRISARVMAGLARSSSQSTGRRCWLRASSISSAGGLCPAIALLPDVHRLFVGAGEELFCYDLIEPRRLWRDRADTGLWGWEIAGATVLMSAELELAAWDKAGEKLWTTFVEPPWSYVVAEDHVTLDVMGEMSRFNLRDGPTQAH